MKKKRKKAGIDIPVRTPGSGLELLKWLIFEPVVFKKYGDSLNRKQTAKAFLKAYPWIVIFAVLFWLVIHLMVAVLDLPGLYPGQFREEIVAGWNAHPGWWTHFIFYSESTFFTFFSLLAFGFAFGFAGGLYKGLSIGLAFGLAFGFTLGLAGGSLFELAGELPRELAFGIAFGFTFGLAGELTLGSDGKLAIGLAYGLIFCLVFFVLVKKLAVGLAFGITFYIFYLRLFPFYPIHLVRSFFRCTLGRNPYRTDGSVWLPIPGVKGKLLVEARQKPEEASNFVDFLMAYRPRQKNLAMHLIHASTAAYWHQNRFDAESLKIIPLISEDKPRFQPSPAWLEKLRQVRETLVAVELQNGIGLKLDYFRQYLVLVKEFRDITLRKESSRWNRYYLEIMEDWQEIVGQELDRLQLLARTEQPIAGNIYQDGVPLNPQVNAAIFLGREDLKEELQHRILTSTALPLFLVQGQRRVGKTSLLKFLPAILGPRFKVVYRDLQEVHTIDQWLSGLKAAFDHTLGEAAGAKDIPFRQDPDKPPVEQWQALQAYMQAAAAKVECKILLAFDEYEGLHKLLHLNPGAGENLLAAMRAFSQHQDKIVFIFVGTALFTELTEPTWSLFFPHAHRLTVDYLKKADTLELIGKAGLEYPAEVPEEIYRLTRGHPTLVQRICREMVNIANTQHRRRMTKADLDQVLRDHVYIPVNGVTELFWQEFCKDEIMKTTARQVAEGGTPTDKKSLFRLEQHGYIIKETNGTYRMRVPIFGQWVKQYAEVI